MKNSSEMMDLIYQPTNLVKSNQNQEIQDLQVQSYIQCRIEREKVEIDNSKIFQIENYFLTHREMYIFVDKLIAKVNDFIKDYKNI
jgi:hypothetical protein